jgi:hypothetical protein
MECMMEQRRTRMTQSIKRPKSLNLSVEQLDSRLAPAVITVTSTSDTVAMDGVVTLREAIIAANTNRPYMDAPAGDAHTPDIIRFNIPGSGVKTIAVKSALPELTGPVIIDGTTQSGYGGTPIIEINGIGAYQTVNGLVVKGGNSTIKGIMVNNFRGHGIVLDSNDNKVIGCYVGIDYRGIYNQGNRGDGIRVLGSNNQIGGTESGERNVISGNGGAGVRITGWRGSNNRVEGNHIGTNANGQNSIFNQDGVVIENGARHNRIGGTTKAARNIITGNWTDGVRITGSNTSNNVVQGNHIGVDSTGRAASLSGRDGVRVEGGANNNTIGGATPGAGNLIGGHGTRRVAGQSVGAGIVIGGFGTTRNVIQGNWLGMNNIASTRIANQGGGILVQGGATGNTIGGSTRAQMNFISDQVNAPGLASTNLILPPNWFTNSLLYMRNPNARAGVYVG